MPWLTIIMAVITFFLAGGSKKENRTKAALAAVGVGAATYGVTHYTKWGQENLGALDGVEFGTAADGSAGLVTKDGSVSTPQTESNAGAPKSTSGAGNTGLWSTLTGWLSSPVGTMAVGGALGATVAGLPRWLLWGGLALGAYLILKD